MKEGHTRSIIKAMSWRFSGAFFTVLIVFIFTKKITLSLGVGCVELLVKGVLYYLHERVWNKISWGKPKHPLEDIRVKKELSEEDKKKVEEQLKSLGYM